MQQLIDFIVEIMFSDIRMPFEPLRMFGALLILTIGAYYDVKNNRDIPSKIVYGSLVLSLLISMVGIEQRLLTYQIAQFLMIFIPFYIIYKLGQIGLADVFYMSSLTLLLPIPPSHLHMINIPFIIIILVSSGLMFSIYMLIYLARNIQRAKKAAIKWEYVGFLFAYVGMVYMLNKVGMSFPILMHVFMALTTVLSMYSEIIKSMMVKRIPIDKAEEEVFAKQFASKEEIKTIHSNVISKKDIKNGKRLGLRYITVYHMPPFIPFLLIGTVISLLYGNLIL